MCGRKFFTFSCDQTGDVCEAAGAVARTVTASARAHATVERATGLRSMAALAAGAGGEVVGRTNGIRSLPGTNRILRSDLVGGRIDDHSPCPTLAGAASGLGAGLALAL
jgi:hypothetical protein